MISLKVNQNLTFFRCICFKKDFSYYVLKGKNPKNFTWSEMTTVTLWIKQTPVPISHIRYRQNITQRLGPGPSGSSFQLIVRSFYNPQKFSLFMCHLFQLLKLLQHEAKVKFVYFFWFLNDFQIRFFPLKFTFILIKSKLIKD